MTARLLETRKLTKIFKRGLTSKHRTVALEHFSFYMSGKNARITTLAGESGSGKTTVANLILGFLPPTSGQILYKGTDIWEMPKAQWKVYRRDVQAIFQDPFEAYNPFYKVNHVLSTVVAKFRLASSRDEARYIMDQALEMVGLRPEEVMGKYPHQLSGGQRQRIMIARAFLLKPRLIIADEPVSMIDASLRGIILEIMLKLKQEFGISFLYITHDLATAYQISDNVFILYRGSIMETGDIGEIINSPQHPYTQALIASIPIPDPDLRWTESVKLPAVEETTAGPVVSCKFSDRCPYVMDMCLKSPPPLYATDRDHYVACYLYREGSKIFSEDT